MVNKDHQIRTLAIFMQLWNDLLILTFVQSTCSRPSLHYTGWAKININRADFVFLLLAMQGLGSPIAHSV